MSEIIEEFQRGEIKPQGTFSRFANLQDVFLARWRSSLRLRIAIIILASGLIVTSVLGFVVSLQMKRSVFEQASQIFIEQFTSDTALAQTNFSAATDYTTGQMQQAANQLVAGMYDPARGLLGAVLMRTPGQETGAVRLVEPATAAATRLRTLVTPDIRRDVAKSDEIAWQSVEVELDNGETAPGLVLGTSLEIPNAGSYELYAAYSLETQNKLLVSTSRLMGLSVLGFMALLVALTLVILRMVLQPVRLAAAQARQLAEGEFSARMKVVGEDELAHLAVSFNKMASSLEDQFTKLNRMSALQTEFVSAVSHELRSPVTTIRMAGQLLYDKREELPATLKRSAELQHAQVINLDAMLSDLLEISRYDAGAMTLITEQVDLAEVTKRVVSLAAPLAQDNEVTTYFEVAGDTTLEVEPRRVERIIRNLVVNALEHSPGSDVQVRVVGNDTAVAVAVADHGIGITPEQAAHVFDRFWRADSSRVRKTGGTGLGLTIAREDALIHGGELVATGELGFGSTFLLVLPKVPGADYVRPLELAIPEAEFVPVLSVVESQEVLAESMAVAALAADNEGEAVGQESLATVTQQEEI